MGTSTRKIKVSSTIPKPEEKETITDEIQGGIVMGVIENILPSLKPMIAKVSVELKKYFGNNEKVFLIRCIEGKEPQVVVLNNLKGSYTISNKVITIGEGEDAELEIEETFNATKSAVIDIHDSAVFVEKLLNGEINKK